MSRRELLPLVKPALQYQAKIKEIKQALIDDQIPLIMKAFAQLEKDITQPVNINLYQPLDASLVNELIEKGYEIEQMHQYDTQRAAPIYTVRISIPFDNHNLMSGFDLFPFSAFFSKSHYPRLTAPEKRHSDIIIEPVNDPPPAHGVRRSIRQRPKQVSEGRKKE